MSKFRQGLAGSLLVVMLVLAGCGGGQKPAEAPKAEAPKAEAPKAEPPKDAPVPGGKVIYADIGDAESLNPIYVNDTSSSFISYLVHDGLVRVNNKTEIVPHMAEKWEVTNEGKTWTFTLRKNLKWQDGKPVTANDVAFTFESIMHPLYAGTRQSQYDKLVGYKEAKAKYDQIKKDQKDKKIDDKAAEEALEKAFQEFKAAGGIKVLNDSTVQFNIVEPFAPFLANLGMGIIPKHLLEGVRPDKMKEHETNRKPVGSGRYKFVEWKKGDQIVLEANPDWYGGRPNIDRIIYKVIPDQNAIAVALETGEVDIGGITPELFDRFKGKQGLKIYEYPTFSYTYMGYNLRNPLFQDVKVRQAITHAIDRKALVDAILLGHGTVADSHGSNVRWDFNPNVPKFEYNKDKAKALLGEAGWKPGPDGILQKDGKQLKFTLMTNQNKVREQVATIIQQQLKEVGIAVEPKIVEWSSFVSKNLLGQDFEVVIVGWALGVDPDAFTIWHSSQTEKGKFNFVGYTNKRVDELLEKGRVTVDQAKRKEMYAEFQNILAQEQPYTFLFFQNTLLVTKDKFKGPIEPGPGSGLLWNIESWWIPKDKQ